MTPVFGCRLSRSVAAAELLLTGGYQDADAVCKHQRQTALHVAAEWGYCDLLSALLRHSNHVDASDAMGHTALLVAAASGESEPLALLAQAGASLNHEDLSGGQVKSILLGGQFAL